MAEFDELLKKLLGQRPELSQADIEERIKQKKEKIGAGYLTDQGALFLIAADLDISIAGPLKVEMGLKDLYVGAKEISVETRVLNLSPTKQYSRKDGTEFSLRTMTVYDGDSTASVKLWDEKANLPGIGELKPGDLIRIIKAYVKSDLDGSATINVGSGSTIEPMEDQSSIPSIDSITVDSSQIKEGGKNLVVSGLVDGPIGSIQFTNSRGQPGKGLKFGLKGKDGKSVRIVVWGRDEADLPSVISLGAKARLLGVRTKDGQQGLEIHGNESTIIQIDGPHEAQPVTARIIAMTKTDAGNRIVGVDGERNLLHFSDGSGITGEFKEGDVIECMPSRAFGNSITLDSNSFVRKMDDSQSIPKRGELRTKISEISAENTYCIEAIVLKIPGRRDIQTKAGESVALSEMFIEDDSGQMWVKGWRNNAGLIDKCSLGEIVSIVDVAAKAGFEGRTELVLGAFSKVTKKD